jgi:hypothetical protein
MKEWRNSIASVARLALSFIPPFLHSSIRGALEPLPAGAGQRRAIERF